MNLHDGVDLYSVPSMQLIKTYSHGNANVSIFKVSFVGKGWLVSGGLDGFARMYDVRSGQILQRLEHDSAGALVQAVASHTELETTTVITATLVIKVWSQNQQRGQSSMPESFARDLPQPSGVSMSQLDSLASHYIHQFSCDASKFHPRQLAHKTTNLLRQ